MSATITVRLDETHKAQLEMPAQSTKRSKSWLAAQAIESYLQREAAEIRAIEESLQEADSPNAVKYDHETVAAWLMSWGTSGELPSPRKLCK